MPGGGRLGYSRAVAHDDLFARAIREHLERGDPFLYGTQWGDPRVSRARYLVDRYLRRRKVPGDLARVERRFVRPYVPVSGVALEIGAGGGRWTQFLLRARRIVIVEHTDAFFGYLERRFGPRFDFYLTSGDEMAGVEDESVDFVFSFGTLVHLPAPTVRAYVQETARVLRPHGVAALQYADKTKRAARRDGPEDAGFSSTTAASFARMAEGAGLELLDHDTRSLNHSNVAALGKRPGGAP